MEVYGSWLAVVLDGKENTKMSKDSEEIVRQWEELKEMQKSPQSNIEKVIIRALKQPIKAKVVKGPKKKK